MNWQTLAQEVIDGKELTNEEAMAILTTEDDELLPLMHGAFTICKNYYGKKVKLNMIMNAKSGYCPEDCGYCSQSSKSTAPIEKYPFISKEEILAGAKRAFENQIGTYCIVASGRGPTRKDVNVVSEAVEEIKEKYGLKVCACLGLLKEEQAEQLKTAGERHHDYITTSHTYEDRVNTVEIVKKHGISPCSGAIVGMNERNEGRCSRYRACTSPSRCGLDSSKFPTRHRRYKRAEPTLLFKSTCTVSFYKSNKRNSYFGWSRGESWFAPTIRAIRCK
jgi:biotin synthase